MPPASTASPNAELRARLKAVEADISRLRDERADLAAQREQAKAAFAGRGDYDTGSTEFKAAERAIRAVNDAEVAIEREQQKQLALLRMLGEGDGGMRTKAVGFGANLKGPGEWLAATIRQKALT